MPHRYDSEHTVHGAVASRIFSLWKKGKEASWKSNVLEELNPVTISCLLRTTGHFTRMGQFTIYSQYIPNGVESAWEHAVSDVRSAICHQYDESAVSRHVICKGELSYTLTLLGRRGFQRRKDGVLAIHYDIAQETIGVEVMNMPSTANIILALNYLSKLQKQ
jgi:hypothetical protein